jgi:hypothetical protein
VSNLGDETRAGTATVPPPPRARLGRRPHEPASSSPQGLPVRRRWGRFAAGAVLALLGAWIFASLYVSAGERVEVLAMSRDVGQFETIEDDDLRTVRVAAGPEVETIDAGERDDIVGRQAALPLLEGSILVPSQVIEEGLDVMAADELMVPVVLDAGLAGVLEPGLEVSVVVVPRQGTDQEPSQYAGWIAAIGEPDDQTGERTVSLVVRRSASTVVAAAANEDLVAILPLGGAEDG